MRYNLIQNNERYVVYVEYTCKNNISYGTRHLDISRQDIAFSLRKIRSYIKLLNTFLKDKHVYTVIHT